MDCSVSGKRVLVTAGGRGIGAAIVRALAELGYDVCFTFRESVEPAKALLTELQSKHPEQEFEASQCDLSRREDVDRLAEQLTNWETLYGFVHNAGQSYDVLAALIDQDNAETLMQVNFWSMTRLIAAAVRPMIQARAGRIIGIGSIAAMRGQTGNAVYAASKGAMLSYLRCLAVEIARKGVTVNYVAPGFVDTEFLSGYDSHRDAIEKAVPAERFAEPAEIAGLVGYLLANKASYITGSVIPIDGGLSATIGAGR